MTRIIRYGLAAVAFVASAWFVIGVRQAQEINAAATLLNNAGTERSAPVQQRARSLLDEAAFLYPGVEVTLLRVQLAENAREWARAGRYVDQATAAEPLNLETWRAYLELKLLHPPFGNGKLLYSRLHMLLHAR